MQCNKTSCRYLGASVGVTNLYINRVGVAKNGPIDGECSNWNGLLQRSNVSCVSDKANRPGLALRKYGCSERSAPACSRWRQRSGLRVWTGVCPCTMRRPGSMESARVRNGSRVHVNTSGMCALMEAQSRRQRGQRIGDHHQKRSIGIVANEITSFGISSALLTPKLLRVGQATIQ